MDNLFVFLILISFGVLIYSAVRGLLSFFIKKRRRGNNKIIAISALSIFIVSLFGLGLTAPPSNNEAATISTNATSSSTDDSKQKEEKRKNITKTLQDTRTQLTQLEYTDTQTIEINNNVPLFTDEDLSLKNKSWEKYGDLDELNRATSAEAMLNQDLMPTEKRGDISNVSPTGWQNKKVGNSYLYNRSHLIGFALSGENDNWKNLITGTAQLNNPEMLRHEMDIKHYLEQDKKNYVRYSVTPIFKDDELLARGVHLMAQSINDDTIMFNVYIHNIQDDVELNYADGSSVTQEEIAEKQAEEEAEKKAEEERIAKEEAEKERIANEQAEAQRVAEENARQEQIAAEQAAQAAQAAQTANPYVDANGNGLIKGSSNGIYHVPGSTYYDRTTNPVAWFSSVEEAQNAGYRAPKR